MKSHKNSEKLAILYICHDYNLGGAAKSLLDMLGGLKEHIHPIVVIPQRGYIVEELAKMGIEYYIYSFWLNWGATNTDSTVRNDKIYKYNFTAISNISDLIRRRNIKLVHSNSIVSPIGAIVAVLNSIPHVWHIREFVEEDFDCELYDKDLYKELFRTTDVFISISKSIQSSYKRKYGIDSVQIYNAINLFSESEVPRKDNYSFLLAGRIQEGKGQWDAVRAIELLISEKINYIHLYIVGNDSSRYAWCMKRYIQEKNLGKYITIYPFQKNISELRSKCKFALTTSKMEGLGRVTVEALLAGQIVIGANTGGTLEIIGDKEERGYLYEQGSYKSLADSIKRAIDGSSNYDSKKTKNEVHTMFGVMEYTQKIMSIYNQLIARKIDNVDKIKYAEAYLKNRCKELEQIEIPHEDFVSEEKKVEKDIQILLSENREVIISYMKSRHIKNVGIYGMGAWGCGLYEELKNLGLSIVYVMDNNSRYLDDIVSVYKKGDDIPMVDLLIVSIKKDAMEVKRELKELYNMNIVTLYEIVG